MILLRSGRVIDPRTSFDGTADVLLDGSGVAAVGADLPVEDGTTVVDVEGMVVGPGFVDLHSHTHSIAGHRLQAMDGVSTALDLEAGLMPVEVAYRRAAAEGRPLNYGFSASWAAARAQVLLGREPDASFSSGLAVLGEDEWQRSSSAPELSRWLRLLESELAAGALGIGVLLGYAPRSDPAEFLAVARLAASAGAPTYTHVRELVEADPTTPIDGSEEIVIAAAETGAAMHHCHVNSTSRRHVDRVLATLSRARSAGSRVTVETYPYGAGSTAIGASFLAPDRLHRWGLRPSSLLMVGTGERIASAGRLIELRATAPGAECIVEFLDEENAEDRALLRQALAFGNSIVASDAMPVEWPAQPQDAAGRPGISHARDSRQWPLPPHGATHPRTAGTFAKSVRLMVREAGLWSWLEAFRRCSFLPARVLDEVSPAARGKGWLGAGSDADIVVLDPDSITDTATYRDPTRASVGVRHLLVNGEFVVRDGAVVAGSYPGRAVRGAPA